MKKTENRYLAVAAAKEKHFGVSVVPLNSKENMRFVDDQFAVAIGLNRYACLPSGVSAVFQRWNAGANSVALPSALQEACWPNDYWPAIWVRSVDAEEIFALTNQVLPDDERLLRLPPFEDGPSMSVGDVVALNNGDVVDVLQCASVGWNALGIVHPNWGFVYPDC